MRLPAFSFADSVFRRTPARPWAIVAAACAVVVGVLLLGVEAGWVIADDRTLDLRVHHELGTPWYAAFTVITDIGGGLERTIMVIVASAALFVMRRWLEAVFVPVCVAGAGGADMVLKTFVGRPRPQLFHHAVAAVGSSFPSGHATTTSALAVAVMFVIWEMWGTGGGRTTAAILATLVTLLVGLSRIVLGVHFPTDVVAGFALGSGWTALMVATFSATARAAASEPSMAPPTTLRPDTPR